MKDFPHDMKPAQAGEVRELTHSECWQLLGHSGVGRVGLRSQPVGVDIVPVNYIVTDRQLFFRSGPGTKMEDLVLHPHVAFQVDELSEGRWSSVVLKGKAVRLAADSDIERSGVLDLIPTQPGRKSNFVRISPDAITGRSFIPQ
jgi:nitroimidazol reductase NimA-like FMN-containing flavoprotein (pyridoxamine 5'-phosphate oxidase superfamily)